MTIAGDVITPNPNDFAGGRKTVSLEELPVTASRTAISATLEGEFVVAGSSLISKSLGSASDLTVQSANRARTGIGTIICKY